MQLNMSSNNNNCKIQIFKSNKTFSISYNYHILLFYHQVHTFIEIQTLKKQLKTNPNLLSINPK